MRSFWGGCWYNPINIFCNDVCKVVYFAQTICIMRLLILVALLEEPFNVVKFGTWVKETAWSKRESLADLNIHKLYLLFSAGLWVMWREICVFWFIFLFTFFDSSSRTVWTGSRRVCRVPTVSWWVKKLCIWGVLIVSDFQSLLHFSSPPSYRGADKSLTQLKKNNWKVTIFRPTRRSLLPLRPGWTDNLLNFFFFWVACKS